MKLRIIIRRSKILLPRLGSGCAQLFELGIMSPNTSQVFKIAVSCMLLCSAAVPAVSQVLPDAIQACARESDSARRLECYDREVAKASKISEQSFGLSQSQVVAAQARVSGPAPKVDKSAVAQVAAIRERPKMGFVVTFDNGQIWVQYEEESVRGIQVGDTVTIKPGALGSFWLVGPTGWATKVHRVQ